MNEEIYEALASAVKKGRAGNVAFMMGAVSEATRTHLTMIAGENGHKEIVVLLLNYTLPEDGVDCGCIDKYGHIVQKIKGVLL